MTQDDSNDRHAESLPGSAERNATRRLIEQGRLIGSVDANGCQRWLGLPYAQPPVGPLRWRAPRAPLPWSGILQADRAGAPAMQRDSSKAGACIGSEDCLYLNIWSPPPADGSTQVDERFPVMVWVHGGANVLGQGDSFDGGVLAASQRVVVVTLNYRLGVFGGFRHPALRQPADSAEDCSGNYGVLDAIAALRWVNRNIGAFGGDSGAVTLFGESAGATLICALLCAPQARALFHRAIAQSGVPGTMTIAQYEHFIDDDSPGDPRSSGELLLQLIVDDRLARSRRSAKLLVAGWSRESVADYLHSKSYADFDRAYRAIAGRHPALSLRPGFLHPVADGTVVPAEGFCSAIRAGRYHRVPVVLGTNKDECTILLLLYNSGFVPRFDTVAHSVIDASGFELGAQYASDLMRANAVDELADALSIHQAGQVFAYRFDWNELAPLPGFANIALGATHGLEVPFVFGHLRLGPEFFHMKLIQGPSLDSYRALSNRMMAYWGAFAASGSPGRGRGGELPEWTVWTRDAPNCLLLDAPARGGIRMDSIRLDKASIVAASTADTRIGTLRQRRAFRRHLIAFARVFSFIRDSDGID